jgi:hypothetical protein
VAGFTLCVMLTWQSDLFLLDATTSVKERSFALESCLTHGEVNHVRIILGIGRIIIGYLRRLKVANLISSLVRKLCLISLQDRVSRVCTSIDHTN